MRIAMAVIALVRAMATRALAAPVAYVMQPAISSVARGADDLLARKDNQRSLAEETARYCDSPEASALPVPAPCRSSRPDADHGRIATRRHRVSHDAGGLNGSRSAPAEPRFPGLRAIARAVRAHRGSENRLHRVLDVLPRENDSLDRFLILGNLRRPDAPAHRQRTANMATIKHMAMNLLSSAAGKDSLKVRRKTAGWDHKYLKALITRTAQ